MRFLTLIMVILAFSAAPAFSDTDINFDTFIKSREVVATLYFASNSEVLSDAEQGRLAEVIQKIRSMQKNDRLIRVEGFSSPEGNQEANFKLSFYRARSVANLIESSGVPAEVTLTGYGDLKARSEDHARERRVEIASYLKPVGMKKIKVAKDKQKSEVATARTAAIDLGKTEIDAYTIDQAIRMKVDDKNRGLADQERIDDKPAPGLSQKALDKDELERGYSLWRKSIDPAYAPKLSQSQQAAEEESRRRFTQWQKAADRDASPDVSQVLPVQPPVIDALMIEQAIMEKIGTTTPAPTAAVSQVSTVYPPLGTSN